MAENRDAVWRDRGWRIGGIVYSGQLVVLMDGWRRRARGSDGTVTERMLFFKLAAALENWSAESA